jgi:flagellar biosynthesis/type III secretory pathway M-ring protein FliF/YscJ
LAGIKERFEGLTDRLADLSVSSRLLVGSLMIIMVMGLFFVAQYAGRADMAPLRIQTAALEPTKAWLDNEGVDYDTDSAGRILVARTDRQLIQVRLATESTVPPSELDWDAMMKDEVGGTIWDSPEVQKQRERRFTMTYLKVMLSNLTFLRDAQVAIDEPDQVRGPGQGFFPATASITVDTVDGPLTGTQARAIRNIVASGISGMKVENVVVVDQQGTLHAGGEVGGVGAGLEETSRGVEGHYENQILNVLGIDGLRVAVSALAEPRNSYEQGREHGEPTTANRRTTSEFAQERGGGSGGRPGYGSNVGPQANQPMGLGGGQKQSELEAEERDNDVIVDATDMAIENPGGYVYKLSAILNVPRNYLDQRWLAEGGEAEPGPAEMKVLETTVRTELMGAISMMLQTTPPANDLQSAVVQGDVTVIFGVGPNAFAAGGGDGGGIGLMAGGAIASVTDGAIGGGSGGMRTWILGGLSLAAIGAMFLIVRRSSRATELPTAEELLGEPPTLESEVEMVMGEAEEVEPPLDARVLDDEELRRKQMLSQLNELVVREPSEAAILVKQWIRQTA